MPTIIISISKAFFLPVCRHDILQFDEDILSPNTQILSYHAGILLKIVTKENQGFFFDCSFIWLGGLSVMQS